MSFIIYPKNASNVFTSFLSFIIFAVKWIEYENRIAIFVRKIAIRVFVKNRAALGKAQVMDKFLF